MLRTISQSSRLQLQTMHQAGRERAARRVESVLGERIREALSEPCSFGNLEELGRWTTRRIGGLFRIATSKLPQGVAITALTVTYFSQPDCKGEAVMKVDCRTGKIEIY